MTGTPGVSATTHDLVRRLVAAAPRLSSDQIDRLRALLSTEDADSCTPQPHRTLHYPRGVTNAARE